MKWVYKDIRMDKITCKYQGRFNHETFLVGLNDIPNPYRMKRDYLMNIVQKIKHSVIILILKI